MNKKAKTSKSKKRHTTTKPKMPANKGNHYKEIYFCTKTWRERPVPLDTILQFAHDFWQWAHHLLFEVEKPEPYSLSYWLKIAGITQGTYKNWYQKYPHFKMIMDDGKEMLGLIRENGVLKKEFSEKYTILTLHNYLQEWRDANEYHDARAKEIRSESEDSKTLQPIMLDADQFEKVLHERNQASSDK